jgi:hypothetical protein
MPPADATSWLVGPLKLPGAGGAPRHMPVAPEAHGHRWPCDRTPLAAHAAAPAATPAAHTPRVMPAGIQPGGQSLGRAGRLILQMPMW